MYVNVYLHVTSIEFHWVTKVVVAAVSCPGTKNIVLSKNTAFGGKGGDVDDSRRYHVIVRSRVSTTRQMGT